MMPFNAFTGEEHRPFSFDGEVGAALLLHGFLGTPAEMRSLGSLLHRHGWSAQGILLPGFGAQIETLLDRSHRDWIEAAVSAARELQRRHRPIVLIGFSMGGAVALQAAAQTQPDGLILINPLSRMEGMFWHLLPVIKFIIPTVRPFNMVKIDFDSEETRKNIAQFMPEADLDDPQVREAVLRFSLPTALFDHMRLVGEGAYRQAARLRVPTLIIQGARDATVSPAATRKLAARLPNLVHLAEVDAEHQLLNPELNVWDQISSLVLGFIQEVKHKS